VPRPKATNGGAARKLDEVERRLRRALEHALDNTPASAGVSPIIGALAALVDFDDAVECAALEMAETAIQTLLTRGPGLRGAVWAWYAHRNNCDGDRDVLALLELTRAVELTVYVCRTSPQYLTADKRGTIVRRRLTVTGRPAVERLRALLVRRFGESVPSVDVREVRDGEGSAREVIKYLTKDIDSDGRKIAPELYAPVYEALDGSRVTQATTGFMALAVDEREAFICPHCGTVDAHVNARRKRPGEAKEPADGTPQRSRGEHSEA
jgi:hypothetical protein